MSKIISTSSLLQEWSRIKKEMSSLQKQEKQIKDAIHLKMNDRGVNRLTSSQFVATRRTQSRRTITKDAVPDEVWLEYSSETRFPVITLKKI